MPKPNLPIESIPPELRTLDRWVCWRRVQRKGRPTKVPYNPHSKREASCSDPATWTDFATAYEALPDYDGLGFNLGAGIAGVDLDGCRNPSTGEVEEWAGEIVRTLDTYTEVSPSGKGLHLWCRGSLPAGPRRRGRIEMYEKGRYFTVTGEHLEGTPQLLEDRTQQLAAVHGEVFGEKPGPLSAPDNALLEAMFTAKNGAAVRKLWEGDWQADYSSQSEADLALCNHLAYYCRGNAAQVDALFRQSGLHREKWLRPDYRERTISKALAGAIIPICPTEGGAFTWSDLGNAERLVATHGENLHYSYPLKQWFWWTGQKWAADQVGKLDRLAKGIGRSLQVEARALINDKERERMLSWARTSQGERGRTNLIASTQSEEGLPILPADLDCNPWLLNVENGTLDLRSGKLQAHRREDLITKLIPLPFEEGAACPRWERFLAEVFDGDQGLVEFIQRAVGYSLTGKTVEQCFFLLHGTGENGKSTFLGTLRALLGDYGHKAAFETFLTQRADRVRDDIAVLAGRRLVTAAEPRGGGKFAESLVKELTGGDIIRARDLYQAGGGFEFTPAFKIWLAANTKPVIVGGDWAIWRRIRLLPFNVTFGPEERDDYLGEWLVANELPGILAWAVMGCRLWQEGGLAPPPAVEEATKEYRNEQDILEEFLISSRVVISPRGQATAADLYRTYADWCAGENTKPLSKYVFGLRLAEHGFQSKRTKLARLWVGIGLPDPQPRLSGDVG